MGKFTLLCYSLERKSVLLKEINTKTTKPMDDDCDAKCFTISKRRLQSLILILIIICLSSVYCI